MNTIKFSYPGSRGKKLVLVKVSQSKAAIDRGVISVARANREMVAKGFVRGAKA